MEDRANIQVLELGRVGETAQLWINGQTCGACVSAPFRFEVYGYLQNGDNTIRIEVMNNLGYRGRDSFSKYLPLPPIGLLGPVSIGKRKEQ